VAEDGYEFAADDRGALQVKATLNGKPVLPEIRGNKKEIVVTYYFTESTAEAKISSVAVTGIDAPKIGEKPDYTAAVSDSRYALQKGTASRTKNGITWYNSETKTAMWPSSDKFEEGGSYYVVIGLTAEDGYEFEATAAGVPKVSGTVNGKKAEVSGQDEYNVYLTYTFDALKAEPAPVVEFDDVPESAYYYQPVQWAVGLGVTAGTSADTFSPDMTCSQAHILTFLWRAMGSPKATIKNPYKTPAVTEDQYFYVPFVWAWENGLISNPNHDPHAPCSRSDVVTYLWKLDGSPKGGTTPFTDVPASAPYAQAVAWALKNEITAGTSPTTFSPDMTCTRGQIVTFLWKYMSL